ncbi:MAG: isoprenylcysteine carboxylmethyltransferase family protein [Pseudomonadota bacterium]
MKDGPDPPLGPAAGDPIPPALARRLARLDPFRRSLQAPAPARPADQARSEIRLALIWGALTHGIFGLAALSMLVGLGSGMRLGIGAVPQPWAWAANLLLLLQFPLGHSWFLSRRGRGRLGRLAPGGEAAGRTLATSTYALIASLQLLALFWLWTPSGQVWRAPDGGALALALVPYAAAWAFLGKASWDAGAEVQSGLLGWFSLLRGIRPIFPPMPERGAFRFLRQPIYLAFALVTWTVPVWTPDALLTATVLTLYCALGPLLKERRFDAMFGERWRTYRARTPYWLPRAPR